MRYVYKKLWQKIFPNLNVFFSMFSSFLFTISFSTQSEINGLKNATIEQDIFRQMVKKAQLLFGFLEHKVSETGCF